MPATRMQRWLLATAAGFALGAAATAIVLQSTPRATRPAADPVAFVRDHPQAVHWKWTGTQDTHIVGAVGGEAYFDPATAEGVLEIEGLAANDPTREQYQLWIFDATRDERYPVDGGVFDVRGSGRACIPVRARLPVSKPVGFAVTVEPPGGVVVSDRRIALVAKP
jgi:anti-sigma-K factor RskA